MDWTRKVKPVRAFLFSKTKFLAELFFVFAREQWRGFANRVSGL